MPVPLFLRQLLLFAGPILLLSWPADLILSSALKKTGLCEGEYEVWEDIYQGRIDADIAVYGSSRAWVHIDPAVLQQHTGLSAYNFGIDGHGVWLQQLRHQEYQRHNPAPRVIILSLDFFIFSREKNALYNYEQFLPYLRENKNLRQISNWYSVFSEADFSLPFYRYLGQWKLIVKYLESRLAQSSEPYRRRGFRGMDRAWDGSFEQHVAELGSYEAEIEPGAVALLDSLAAWCRDEGVQLIPVYSPEYIEGQRFVRNRAEVMSVFREFAARWNLPLLDFSREKICYDRRYFYNATHLNAGGARLFSEQLARALRDGRGDWPGLDMN